MSKLIPGAALAAVLMPLAAAAADPVLLYRDAATGQIYSEPGPGRTPIGRLLPDQPDSAPVAAPAAAKDVAAPSSAGKPAWYDKLSLRGYTQLRYNQELDDGADRLRTPGDRFVGEDQTLGLRRARVVLSGKLSDRVSLYFQPDFASTPSGSSSRNFAQLRDLYADIYLDAARAHRVRVGQSKIPFGFENLQSSSNRLAPDRADALNSGVRDERDLAVLYYYTPQSVARRFSRLTKEGLKGSGDYGMLGLGVYSGQGPNRAEGNDQFHVVAHSSYPLELASGQVIEFGVDAYHGRFVSPFASVTVDGQTFTPDVGAPGDGFRDERVAAHLVVYPQPFGFQAEWNVGRGPELNLDTQRVEVQSLHGGYVQAMYRRKTGVGEILPYVKWQTYRGAAKAENNAPHMEVDELEVGIEWQIIPELELLTAFAHMERSNLTRAPYEIEEGDLLRLQLQWNY